jgi:hypothetical protein
MRPLAFMEIAKLGVHDKDATPRLDITQRSKFLSACSGCLKNRDVWAHASSIVRNTDTSVGEFIIWVAVGGYWNWKGGKSKTVRERRFQRAMLAF